MQLSTCANWVQLLGCITGVQLFHNERATQWFNVSQTPQAAAGSQSGIVAEFQRYFASTFNENYLQVETFTDVDRSISDVQINAFTAQLANGTDFQNGSVHQLLEVIQDLLKRNMVVIESANCQLLVFTFLNYIDIAMNIV